MRILYIARGVGNHERVDNAWVRAKYGIDAGAVRRLRHPARRRVGRAARASPGSARRPRRRCSAGSATWRASSPPPRDPDADLGPGPRGKIKAAADYLAVAPTVVAVARDIDLDRTGMDRPVTPRDPDLVARLAERYALESPATRLVEALTR